MVEYEEERDVFVVRHYRIMVRPVGINRAVKKTLARKVPALSGLQVIIYLCYVYDVVVAYHFLNSYTLCK